MKRIEKMFISTNDLTSKLNEIIDWINKAESTVNEVWKEKQGVKEREVDKTLIQKFRESIEPSPNNYIFKTPEELAGIADKHYLEVFDEEIKHQKEYNNHCNYERLRKALEEG
jgi:hypothetical protein